MKFHYYPETDSLYIELSASPSADSIEVSNGVIVDYDKNGAPVGIDIDNASKVVDLSRLEADSLPLKAVAIA